MTGLSDPMVGRVVLNRYRIVRVLAHGGMGVLYIGRTEGAAGFSRPVVIKRILPHLITNPRMAGLFVREARILAELQHPSIVSILDFGEEDSAYIMVLEYVRGYDLGLWFRYVREVGALFTGDVALQIMIKVLDALHYAHAFKRPDGRELNIVHRDISPGNVLLDTEGNVKLLDFGIARFADDGGEYRTRSGEFKGKAAYTAPEVFKGEDATAKADIFSAAVVLYKILSGFNPFEGENSAQTMKRITDLNPQPITYIRADLSKQLDGVLAKGLAKRPSDRWATAAEFAEALRACRRQTDEQVNARFVSDIQRDFLGDMPERLGLEPLSALEAAWRWQATAELHALVDSGAEDERTMAGKAGTSTPPPTRRSVAVSVGVSAVAVAALGLGIFSFLRSQNSAAQAPSFVVVQKNETMPVAVQPAPAAAPAPTPEPVPAATGGAPGGDAVEKAPAKRRPEPRVRDVNTPDPVALTRSFRRHQNDIERCFADNAETISGQPEVAIQFAIDAAGAVESADTVPANLASTALGDCLLAVARKTSFGAQPHGVSFRIPLKARKSGP